MVDMFTTGQHRTSPIDRFRRALVVAGPVTVLAVAWASTGVRDTMAIANVALVMAVLTIAAATVSRRAGMGAIELDRRVVFAFVDQLELVLSSMLPPPLRASGTAH